MKTTRMRLGIAAAVLVPITLLSACRSSGNSSTTTQGASGPTGSAATGSQNKSPVTVGIFATTSADTANAFVQPWSPQGLQAAAKVLNAHGGIDGHTVNVSVCNNGGDPNKDATCARQAVSQHWLAVVGVFDTYGTNQTLPILQAAKIPYVAALEVSPTEYQSPVAFPIEAGTIAGTSGTAAQMVADGCKKPAFVQTTDAVAQLNTSAVSAIFSKAKIPFGGPVNFAPNTTDFGPTVATVIAHDPDCVLMGNAAGSAAVKIFSAIVQSGQSPKLYVAPAELSPDDISALGSHAEGIRGASTAPLPNNPSPAMKQMVANLTADKGVPNEFSFNAYEGLMMIASVAKGMPELTGSALIDKLNSSTAADAGAFGKINFTKARDSKAFPRLFNPVVWYSEIKNKQWTGVTADAPATNVDKYLP